MSVVCLHAEFMAEFPDDLSPLGGEGLGDEDSNEEYETMTAAEVLQKLEEVCSLLNLYEMYLYLYWDHCCRIRMDCL